MKLTIRVIPRSSKNEFIKLSENTYKLKLMAAPVDGAANTALIKFLSTEFGLPKSAITIIKGLRSKNKIVEIK